MKFLRATHRSKFSTRANCQIHSFTPFTTLPTPSCHLLDFIRLHSHGVNLFTVCISLPVVTAWPYSHEIAETTATEYTKEAISDGSWLSGGYRCARIIKWDIDFIPRRCLWGANPTIYFLSEADSQRKIIMSIQLVLSWRGSGLFENYVYKKGYNNILSNSIFLFFE